MKAFKYLAYSAGLALSTLATTSCKESLLEIQPIANNTADTFYQDESQLNQAVVAIYNGCLSLPQTSSWNMSEFRSDNINPLSQGVQRDFSDISNFRATSQTGQIQTTWSDLFEIVYRANILQERIQPFTFARVNQFVGEARFLRALAYFDLVRYWGPVPIADRVYGIEDSKQIPRAPIADVYQFIVNDLKFAAENLPASYATTDKGRATKWAAKALLGKVYLTMYGYPLRDASALPLAKQQLLDVYAAESATTFSMAPSFPDLFKTTNDNRYAIFEIQYISGGTGLGSTVPFDQGNTFPTFWSAFAPNTANDIVPSPGLFGAGWPKVDRRKAATIDSVIRNPTTGVIVPGRPQFTKFLEKGTTAPQNNRDYPNNFPILRFEDVMLLYAEALNEEVADGANVPALALTIINRIRVRSGIAPLTTMTKVAFRAAILRERRWEFVVEGQRWFDLVRTGNAIAVITQHKIDTAAPLGRTLDEHDLLFPIPLLELRINPGFWEQNPGYN
jgi:hypothetical protein